MPVKHRRFWTKDDNGVKFQVVAYYEYSSIDGRLLQTCYSADTSFKSGPSLVEANSLKELKTIVASKERGSVPWEDRAENAAKHSLY